MWGERGDIVPPNQLLHTTAHRSNSSIHASRSVQDKDRTRRGQIDRSRKRICALRSGRRWLVHLSRHCLPTRPGSDCDITAHFRSPCLITISLRILQASEHARSSTSSASATSKHLLHRVEPKRRRKEAKSEELRSQGSGALTRPPPRSRAPCAGVPCSRRCRRPLVGAAAAASAEPRSRRRAERWT